MKKAHITAIFRILPPKVTLSTEDDTFPFEGFVTLDGQPFDGTLLENKYILVNIWATWCP